MGLVCCNRYNSCVHAHLYSGDVRLDENGLSFELEPTTRSMKPWSAARNLLFPYIEGKSL